MKYDDASWHYGGDFPESLPPEAGATHAGMFLAWVVLSGLASDLHYEEFEQEVERLRARTVTPGAYLLEVCDEKLVDRDLSEEGNRFAQHYFVFETGRYLRDYEQTLATGLPTTYHVPDSWESYDKLRPLLDRRYEEWRSERYDD